MPKHAHKSGKQPAKRRRMRERSESPDPVPEKRWRPWRPRDESSDADSDAGVGSSQNNCFKDKHGEPVPFILNNITAKADVIPIFDPERNDMSASQWLNKIEQLATIHSWTDAMKSYFMQSRLDGMAKVWHASLQDYDMNWEDWKKELSQAFPRKIDFVELLREMLNRRKVPQENMTQYFYSKYAMLNRLEITNEKAVACIIDGLPPYMRAPARAGNYDTPSILFSKFLSVMEDSKIKPQVTKTQTTQSFKNGDSFLESNTAKEQRKAFTCFLCHEPGHSVKRCPKNNFANNRPMCGHCNKPGHTTDRCWYKLNTTPPSSTGITKQENVHLLAEVNDIYFKTVLVNDIPARAYFDSGAKVNVCNLEFYHKLNLPMQNCDLIVGGFGGTPVAAKGKVDVTLNIDDYTLQTQLIITEVHMGAMDIILGQPVINDPNLIVSISGSTFSIKAKTSSTPEVLNIDTTVDENIKVTVKCKETTEIPAGHIMMIKVSLDQATPDTVFVDSCSRKYNQREFSITASIVHDGGWLEVVNKSGKSLQLLQGETLARGLKCQDIFLPEPNSVPSVDSQVLSIDFENINCGSADPIIKRRLFEILEEFSDCFSKNTTELGCTDKIEMKIELNTEKPICYRPYRLSIKEKEIVREKIDDLLENGVIQESTSEFASPIIIVRKKTGDYRLCVDYRKLNSATIKDKYPLPIIEDQVEKLSGKKFFTSLDLSQGFYQIPMSKESVPKTGFVTPEGHYEFLRMPFGLANSPCVFQRLMDKILGPLRFDKVLPYIDDLLIPSTEEEEGLQVLRQVLQILRDSRLTLNLSKCSFLQKEIEYLGYDISKEGIRPGQKKIEAVAKYKEPTNVHELRMFLGLTSYFRKFVQNYAVITHDLYILLKKDQPWIWGKMQQAAFDKLKQILTQRPILAVYNSKAETEVHTDASSKGIAGILLQKQSDNVLKPVAYFSRKTSKEESLYHSFELETLAVVESLRRFRVYLAGIHFHVVTDCVAVRQTFEKKDLLPRVARWWLSIQEYDMDITHKPGVCHKHVDALSRTPVEVCVLDLLDWVVCLQTQDCSIRLIRQKLENNEADPDIKNNYTLLDGKVYRNLGNGELRIVVPKAARWNVMRKYHDDIGHPGLKRCDALIKQECWFPKMTRCIRKYVNSCLDCLFKRGQYGKSEGQLHPIEKVAEPMHTLHIDHLGPFCKSGNGMSYLFVIVDSFTKFIWAKPTKTTKSAEAEQKLEELFSSFGYPKRMVSDSGAAFTSKRFKQFCNQSQIKHVINSVASPRSNGQVERFNRTLLEAINKSTQDEKDWDKCINKVVWGINNTVNSTTGFTAYKLMFNGQRTLLQGMSENNYDDEQTISQNKERAAQNISKTSEAMKKRFDGKRKSPTIYKVGDLVLWKGAQSKNKEAVRKLKEVYSGPYRISKVLGNDRYIITSIKGLKGYKKYQATVASDSLRKFIQQEEDNSDSQESEVDSTEELIDLLEG